MATLKEQITEWAAENGRRGGKARLTKMTAEDRRRVAKLAAQARWGKKTGDSDPNPTDPQGPKRDQQWAEAGIMSTPRRRPAASVSKNHLSGRRRAAAA